MAPDEIADPRPFAEIIRQWSTLHPEFAFLPRKFKIAITGAQEDRAATAWHDVGLHLVRNADNLGFVLAASQGAALARGRHLLLLNNDAIVQQGALAGERAMTQAKSWGSWPARYSSSSAAIRLRR